TRNKQSNSLHPQLDLQSGHSLGIRAIQFSADGDTLASLGLDLSVKIWDLRTGDLLKTISGPRLPTWGLGLSPNASTVAAAADDKIRLYDTRSGRVRSVLPASSPLFGALVFSPDGRRLAGASAHGDVTVWDLHSARPQRLRVSNP